MASFNSNELHDGDSEDICVYYYEHSSPSRKVLIALLERNVVFRRLKIDLIKREQHERWYLEKVSKLCISYIGLDNAIRCIRVYTNYNINVSR